MVRKGAVGWHSCKSWTNFAYRSGSTTRFLGATGLKSCSFLFGRVASGCAGADCRNDTSCSGTGSTWHNTLCEHIFHYNVASHYYVHVAYCYRLSTVVEKVICPGTGWPKEQNQQFFTNSIRAVEKCCRRLCWKVTKYGIQILLLTMSGYELVECPSYCSYTEFTDHSSHSITSDTHTILIVNSNMSMLIC